MAPKRPRDDDCDDKVPSLEDLNELVQKLREAPAQERPAVLLALKQWQRAVQGQISASTDALMLKKKSRSKNLRNLESLKCERLHLEQRIQNSQNVDDTHLAKLVRAEKTEDVDTKLNEFLGASVGDPSHKPKILARLHAEINTRGGLERDVALQKKQLQSLRDQLKEQKSFLSSLPSQVATIERYSKNLQKLVTSHPDAHPQMATTARLQRIQTAKSLPAPLYTLYRQLQHYFDSIKESSNATPVVVHASHVLWNVTFPDPVSDQKKHKKCAIRFECVDSHVVATATNCASTLYQDVFLDNLFPNDCPTHLANSSSSTARPYQWCNALAGIALVAEKSSGDDASSALSASVPSMRLVAHQIHRRARANATLKYCLTSLSQLKLPTIPKDSEMVGDLPGIILSFSDKDGKRGDSQRSYEVNLESKDGVGLWAVVKVALDEYPAHPPQWKLSLSAQSSSSAQNSLYHNDLALLEHQVNQEKLEDLVGRAFPDSDENESGFDWILVLQLRHILLKWAALSKSGPHSVRKGRDRHLVDT